MPIDTVKVTVENKRQIFTLHLFYVQMMQRGKRDNLILLQLHWDVVHLDGKRTALYPQKLIQSLVTLQRPAFVEAGCHCDIAVQARIQLIVHKHRLFDRNTQR